LIINVGLSENFESDISEELTDYLYGVEDNVGLEGEHMWVFK